MKKSKISAFSLIELAVVLTVAGISIGSGMVVFNQYSELSKISQTKIKMEAILEAIDDYADKFSLIPCPADGTDKFADTSFGVGSHDTSECTTENQQSTNTVMGVVPVSTLNLYPTTGIDAWGNKISYIIDQRSAEAGGGPSDGINNSLANVDLRNYEGTSSYTDVVVVLISHGSNGFGAYPGRGGARFNPTGGNAAEDNNNSPSQPFHASVSVAEFDDIVYFWTRDQILDDEME